MKGAEIMNNKENSKKTFNKQAFEYDSNIQGQHARKLYQPILEVLLGKHISSLLDLGCGTGELLKEIYLLGITDKLIGMDISPNMISVAKQKLSNTAKLILGDSEKLPFQKNSFDVVVCNDSFHHYPSPDKVLEEVSRVLKKEGLLIIGDCWQPIGARQIMNCYMKHSNEGDVKIYSKREMISFLSNHFCQIEWKKIGYTSSLTTAKKR